MFRRCRDGFVVCDCDCGWHEFDRQDVFARVRLDDFVDGLHCG